MIDFLHLLGIHNYDIEVTEEKIKDTFEEIALDNPDDLAERTVQLLCEQNITEDLGNQIIACMLEAAAGILEDMVAPFKPEINIYCNGADSHFSLLHESDKNVIRAAKANPNLDIEFVEWLGNNLADDRDLLDVVNNDTLCDALYELRSIGGHLVWENVADYSEEEIDAREKECLDNPYDTGKIFFMSATGCIWTSETGEDMLA